MTEYTYNGTYMHDSLLELVAENPTRTAHCTYFVDGGEKAPAPECVMGYWFEKHDLSHYLIQWKPGEDVFFTDLATCNVERVMETIEADTDGRITFSPDAKRLAMEMQEHQDHGQPWGLAFQAAVYSVNSFYEGIEEARSTVDE